MAIEINNFFPGTLHPNSIVGGCIEIFENVWPECKETIDAVDKECANPESGISWSYAETLSHGKSQEYRTNYNLGITDFAKITNNELMQNIHNQFYVLLLAATIPYAEKHKVLNLYHEPYNMLRYRSGQEYKIHSDGDTSTGRSISAVLYLNDDYVGGEIEFPNFGIKIKPEPGMLIIFPSNYPYAHIAHPVKDGTKYSIVTWIKDRL